MSAYDQGPLAKYNSLTDRHLMSYFSNDRMRRHLVKNGLITKGGEVVSDAVYRVRIARREHRRRVRDLIAQAIIHKALEMERSRQIDIRKKIEEIAKIELVRRVRSDCNRLGDEECLAYFNEGNMEPQSRTKPSKNLSVKSKSDLDESKLPMTPDQESRIRLRKLLPNEEIETKHLSQLDSLTLGEYARILEKQDKYRMNKLPYLGMGSENIRHSMKPAHKKKSSKTKKKGANKKGESQDANATQSARSSQSKAQAHTTVSVLFHAPANNRPFEVMVIQQPSGGNTLILYKESIENNTVFQVTSHRHKGFPFSLTFYIDNVKDSRISTCCEYKHKVGKRIGGPSGHFSLFSVEGDNPCFKCLTERDLENEKKQNKTTDTKSNEHSSSRHETISVRSASENRYKSDDEFESSSGSSSLESESDGEEKKSSHRSNSSLSKGSRDNEIITVSINERQKSEGTKTPEIEVKADDDEYAEIVDKDDRVAPVSSNNNAVELEIHNNQKATPPTDNNNANINSDRSSNWTSESETSKPTPRKHDVSAEFVNVKHESDKEDKNNVQYAAISKGSRENVKAVKVENISSSSSESSENTVTKQKKTNERISISESESTDDNYVKGEWRNKMIIPKIGDAAFDTDSSAYSNERLSKTEMKENSESGSSKSIESEKIVKTDLKSGVIIDESNHEEKDLSKEIITRTDSDPNLTIDDKHYVIPPGANINTEKIILKNDAQNNDEHITSHISENIEKEEVKIESDSDFPSVDMDRKRSIGMDDGGMTRDKVKEHYGGHNTDSAEENNKSGTAAKTRKVSSNSFFYDSERFSIDEVKMESDASRSEDSENVANDDIKEEIIHEDNKEAYIINVDKEKDDGIADGSVPDHHLNERYDDYNLDNNGESSNAVNITAENKDVTMPETKRLSPTDSTSKRLGENEENKEQTVEYGYSVSNDDQIQMNDAQEDRAEAKDSVTPRNRTESSSSAAEDYTSSSYSEGSSSLSSINRKGQTVISTTVLAEDDRENLKLDIPKDDDDNISPNNDDQEMDEPRPATRSPIIGTFSDRKMNNGGDVITKPVESDFPDSGNLRLSSSLRSSSLSGSESESEVPIEIEHEPEEDIVSKVEEAPVGENTVEVLDAFFENDDITFKKAKDKFEQWDGQKVTSLTVRNCELPSYIFNYIANKLETQKDLKKIELSGCEVEISLLKLLAKTLYKWPLLDTIILSNNVFVDYSLFDLINVIDQLYSDGKLTLNLLDVSNCALQENDFGQIIKMLYNNTCVTNLILDHNPMDARLWQELRQAMEHNSNLKSVAIRNCISDGDLLEEINNETDIKITTRLIIS